jgi:hypothetical protein
MSWQAELDQAVIATHPKEEDVVYKSCLSTLPHMSSDEETVTITNGDALIFMSGAEGSKKTLVAADSSFVVPANTEFEIIAADRAAPIEVTIRCRC